MDFEQTRIFVKIVQSGSFSKAADKLKLPKSTVSRALSRLENETGTKLIVRTTRSLTLTASGRAFYDATLGPVQQIEEAQKSLYGKDSILTGLVRITAPEDLGSAVIAPTIADLSVQHPDLSFELEYTDEVIDLVRDGFDLAIRVGRLNESRFKVKKAGEIVLIPVASPGYLKDRAKIRHPKDLQSHLCLSLSLQGVRDKWTLRAEQGTVHTSIKPKIISNQMSSILEMAVSGAGVALVSHFLCQPYLKSGELVRVLPGWSGPGIPVAVVSPLASSSSARLKITSDRIWASLNRALS